MQITHLSSFILGKSPEMSILAHCSSFMNLMSERTWVEHTRGPLRTRL